MEKNLNKKSDDALSAIIGFIAVEVTDPLVQIIASNHIVKQYIGIKAEDFMTRTRYFHSNISTEVRMYG